MDQQNNIVCANVNITGIRPLLWHHFGIDALPLNKIEKSGVAGNDPDEWKRSVLVTRTKQLYIEPSYIFSSIREGAKYTKKSKSSLQPLISATLQVLDEIILIDRVLPEELSTDKTKPVFLDIKSVNNPSTRGRNIRYRVGASNGWNASFKIIWDKTLIGRQQMECILIDAGRLCGIGDGRSIGYGRYLIKSFDVENYA